MSDLAAIDSYLALLAKHGVHKIGPLNFDGNSFPEVEMHDRGAAFDGGALVPRSFSQNAPIHEDLCSCGHPLSAHQGGFCVYPGLHAPCAAEVCAKGKAG